MGEIKPPVLVGRNDRGAPDSISSQILKIATRIPVKGGSDQSYGEGVSSTFLKRRTLFTPPKPAEVERATRVSFFLA